MPEEIPLRDQFALRALPDAIRIKEAQLKREGRVFGLTDYNHSGERGYTYEANDIASIAYAIADAMVSRHESAPMKPLS